MSALGFKARVDPVSPVYNRFLRFTSGLTSADFLAARDILIHLLAHVQALVGLESGIEHTAAQQVMGTPEPYQL